MTKWSVPFAVVAWSMMCLPVVGEDMARENAELRRRVENLEQQVGDLQDAADPAPKAAPRTTTVAPDEARKPFWSSLDIQFYGYIKADAAWDSSRVTTGNFVLFADEGGEDDEEFNLTARQTRFGLRINGPDLGDIETSGLIEGDFYGAGGTENKANFRMRHAYMKLLWPEDDFSVLAGQTWDVVSPLYPSTLNFTILWDAGNIGYRHPQIRLTKGVTLGDGMELEMAGAISRTISDIEEAGGGGRPGENAGFPTLQGRVGLAFPWLGLEPTVIGLSGHWGEEEYTDTDIESWSVNLDVLQPVNECLSFKGEAFTGDNLDDYFGGIGQGVRDPNGADGTAEDAIGSSGGWAAVSIKADEDWRFNVGFGIDHVDTDDLGDSGRTRNRAIFGNAIYAVSDHMDVGVELSHWKTDYKDAGDVEDVRIQGSFIYKF